MAIIDAVTRENLSEILRADCSMPDYRVQETLEDHRKFRPRQVC